MGVKRKNTFYAWRLGDDEGIVATWAECDARVSGRSNARYKGFRTREDAVAWLAGGALWGGGGTRSKRNAGDLPEGAVFFDSGTGSGEGTEINVTDRDGVPLVHLAVAKERLTPRGTVFLTAGRTNNYGELLACLLALRVARKLGLRTVAGDSRLVLDFWSRAHLSATARADPDLARLADLTETERVAFEAGGGVLVHVPGGLNPADLGFHKD